MPISSRGRMLDVMQKLKAELTTDLTLDSEPSEPAATADSVTA